MSTLNQMQFTGRLGKNPIIHRKADRKPMASFSLVTEASGKNANGEWESCTEWYRVVAYNGHVDFIEKHLKQSDLVLLKGHLQTRDYKDAAGITQKITEIIVSNIKLLSTESKKAAEKKLRAA
jgi:single-strand DNA-binding protein